MFVNTIAKVSSIIIWIWNYALPQPVAALFAFALVMLLFIALFKILWGLM